MLNKKKYCVANAVLEHMHHKKKAVLKKNIKSAITELLNGWVDTRLSK